MKLWVAKVRELGNDVCAVCGVKYGDPDPASGKPCFLNAHHVESRKTNARLRWDALNGVLLCSRHHKFDRNSAHMGPAWFITWLQSRRWKQYSYIMLHRTEPLDINSRDELAAIEASLRADPTPYETEAVKGVEETDDIDDIDDIETKESEDEHKDTGI